MPTNDSSDAVWLAGGWQIGEWRVEPAVNELCRDGQTVRIEPKAMELLVFLANRAGNAVTRDELLSALWPGAVVGDDALSQAVIKLRKALRDPVKSPQYVETIPKRGYRLVAPAKRVEAHGAAPTDPNPQRDTELPIRARSGARFRRHAGTAAIALGLLVTVGIVFLARRHEQAPPLANVTSSNDLSVDRATLLPTVTVMPFETQAGDAEQASLALGIAADLTTDMSRISGLRVIGISTLSGPQPQASGESSPARYLVSGSLQRASGGLKINVRLVDTGSGQVLWAERYERPSRDLAAVVEEMVGRLAGVLPGKISESERGRLARRYTRNPDAYDHFLRGKAAFLARQQAENDIAKEMYRKAIELDPTFARAYAGLALTLTADYRNQWTSDGPAAMAKAFELANTALQIDPDIAEVYGVLGYVHSVRRQHAQAIGYLHRAIALDRSYSDAYAHLGAVYTHIGQPERTVPLVRTAMRLNADAGFIYFLVLGRAYLFQGDTDQAAINLREALGRNPADLETRVFMAATLVAAGDLKAVDWEIEEIRALRPGFSTRTWLDTYPMTDAPQKEQLVRLLGKVGL